VVSEEKIFEKVYRWTTDGHQVMAIAHTGELSMIYFCIGLNDKSRYCYRCYWLSI